MELSNIYDGNKMKNNSKINTVSVIVPVYNALEELKKLVISMQKAKLYPQTEVIFIDDASQVETKQYLKELIINNPKTQQC